MTAVNDLALECLIASLSNTTTQLMLRRDWESARYYDKQLREAVNSRSAQQVARLEVVKGLRQHHDCAPEVI